MCGGFSAFEQKNTLGLKCLMFYEHVKWTKILHRKKV